MPQHTKTMRELTATESQNNTGESASARTAIDPPLLFPKIERKEMPVLTDATRDSVATTAIATTHQPPSDKARQNGISPDENSREVERVRKRRRFTVLRVNVKMTGPPTSAAEPPPAVVGPRRLTS